MSHLEADGDQTCSTSVPVSKNAQESPTLATTSSQPTKQATVAVVPDSCREEAFQDQRRVYESPLESRECVGLLQTCGALKHVEHLVLMSLMTLSMTVPRSASGDRRPAGTYEQIIYMLSYRVRA